MTTRFEKSGSSGKKKKGNKLEEKESNRFSAHAHNIEPFFESNKGREMLKAILTQ